MYIQSPDIPSTLYKKRVQFLYLKDILSAYPEKIKPPG